VQVQWFPGHMAKTRKLIQEQLKLVDVVIELVDARIPQSSRNPLIGELVALKPRIIILNKEDLADTQVTNSWVNFFNKQKNYKAIKFNSTIKKGNILSVLKDALLTLTREKRESQAKKGIKKQVVRCMVVGIPNVGKSTFINNIVGKKVVKTGNKPGITRGKQWIRLDKNIDLLDTPGILWPKFDDPEVGFKLAVTGAISDDVFDFEEAAVKLVEYLVQDYPDFLLERFKLSKEDSSSTPLNILEQMALKRGCLLPGKEIDHTKISNILIREFRNGKIGKISLEKP